MVPDLRRTVIFFFLEEFVNFSGFVRPYTNKTMLFIFVSSDRRLRGYSRREWNVPSHFERMAGTGSWCSSFCKTILEYSSLVLVNALFYALVNYLYPCCFQSDLNHSVSFVTKTAALSPFYWFQTRATQLDTPGAPRAQWTESQGPSVLMNILIGCPHNWNP